MARSMSGAEQQVELRGFDSYEFRLGDELRGERATLGRSLLDVQRQLRIKAAYIAAIENCDTEVFPNKGFIAGYVRSYARYLDMDPEAVFERFCSESGFGGVNASLSPRREGRDLATAAIGTKAAAAPDLSFAPLMDGMTVMQGRFRDVSVSSLGSVAVLILLILGLGYGGFQVIDRLQRVEIAPLDQRQGALSVVSAINAPGLGTQEILPERDVNATALDRDVDLARLYQPRELDVPVLASRDGPISEIDPERTGQFGVASGEGALAERTESGFRDGLGGSSDPVVREEVLAPRVLVAAVRPAWIRVTDATDTIVFEQILEAGEVYTLPSDVVGPKLRSGNAGSVFVVLQNEVFGPVGDGAGVAKNVSLLGDDVRASLQQLTDIPETLQESVATQSAGLE